MKTKITSEYIKKSWPNLENMIYLNTASTGVPTKQCLDGMINYMTARMSGNWGYEDTENLYSDIRSSLSKMLGGTPNEYAFIPSTSVGINSFAYSIDYPENSNIVICDLEFPSNYIPWQNLCKHKPIDLRVVPSKNGEVSIEQFAEKIDENTRVVSISHVQFGSGFRCELDKLSKLAHDVGSYFVTDIIQSAGVIDFDLSKANVDFAASQATKWLAGPIGAGFIYVSKRIWKELNPKFVGWKSVKNHREFGFHERELLEDAGMFHAGSPPMAVYAGFRESLKVLLEIDGRERESAAIENSRYLKKRLDEEEIEYHNFAQVNESPIISALLQNTDNLEEILRKERIYCSLRNGRLRISPHFYNNFHEIDVLIDRIR